MNDDNENFINIYNIFSDNYLNQNQNPVVELQEKKIYLCRYPSKFGIPIFDIYKNEDKFKLKLSCLCERTDELSFEEAFNKLVDNYGEHVDYTDYFECKEPGHDNNQFEYYCSICKLNLCCLCLQKFRICPHKNIFSFNQKFKDFKDDGLEIKNILNNYNNIDPYIKKLYDVIYDNFIEFKSNYSYYYIINKYKVLISNNNF